MEGNILKTLLISLLIIISLNGYAQIQSQSNDQEKKLADSLTAMGLLLKPPQQKSQISLNSDQSIRFINGVVRNEKWKNENDPLRKAMEQLLFYASQDPYDTARSLLNKYPYDSISVSWSNHNPLDTIHQATSVMNPPPFQTIRDSLQTADTVQQEFAVDSLKAAIASLLRFVDEKDSIIINIKGSAGNTLRVWLNSGNDRFSRFWLKNENEDSVTVWIGPVSRNTLGMYLENGIIFRRPMKESKISDPQLNLNAVNNRNLIEISPARVRSHYWKVRSESSFVFNQTGLTNWVRGGENSLALSSDLTGYADYSNKSINLSSYNFIRLKYGLLKTGDDPMRKNMDLLETNSKVNHKAFGKFDFSAILLFKTQIAKGYSYPNDSVPVSKFINPAVVTLGLGLDYKPNKTTSINFSPLTYKGTFVTDTGKLIGHIDQTKYGIPADRKSLHEPGVSLLISNEFKPYKTITVTNRLQLFTNYIHNPENIDVDWEMIATAKINWFTEVRFNTHLVFDDDTKTVVLDKNRNPVLLPDGTQRKTARVQFKELLGFSLSFRF